MSIKWDLRFLNLAQHIAEWSKDPSTKVGAIIASPDNKVISMGFNGFPQSMSDSAECLNNREEKYSRVIHAEMNALIFSGKDVTGCTLYTSLFSCDRCFVHLAQSGIRRFVSPEPSMEHLARWADSFDRVKKYAKEMDLELVVYNIDNP